MQFGKLAEYLEKLEVTPSRNQMTEILAKLYSEIKPEEAKEVTYLLSGTLGPAYRTPNFGVADKMFLRVFGDEASAVFKRVGDMGLVAEELHTRRTTEELDCEEVYKKMLGIATAGGEGSQEKKIELIRALITHLDARSAKYVTRIVLGKLRTGFSDMTVLDALSWMAAGDKSMRKKIEEMYNVRADLGEIAEELVRNKKPRRIEPEIGTPILMAKAERASSGEEIWERNGRCAVEYKLDGLRIQAHVGKHQNTEELQVTLFTRGMENMTEQFPEIVDGLKNQTKYDCIVEGEVIAVGKDGKFLPFQETMQRKRKYDIVEMAGKIPLKYYLFDVLYVKGKTVMEEPNQKRREILEELLKPGEVVKVMERKVAENAEDVENFFDVAIEDRTEGIIAKRLDGPYQAGARDFNWIKYKRSYGKAALSDTIDVAVMGYDFGQGKRVGFGIGDFLVGVFDPDNDRYLTVAKIGTGLSDEEWRRMKKEIDEVKTQDKPEEYEVRKEMNVDVWGNPKIVVEIQADEITKSPMHTSGYALRFPRLISWREKKPEDATSLKEILGMVEKQKA